MVHSSELWKVKNTTLNTAHKKRERVWYTHAPDLFSSPREEEEEEEEEEKKEKKKSVVWV